MKSITSFILCTILWVPSAPAQKKNDAPLFSKQNLVAWCIVPFDKMKRTPGERAEMLKDLGITQLAYDWREEHLPTMEEEIQTLKKNGIKLKSVWFWINGGSSGEILDESNNFILQTLKENGVKTELWVSFNDRVFADVPDTEKLQKAVAAIDLINKKAREIGCSVHLYNHGSWFGEPQNQVRIIQTLGAKDIGMVYNFHHARHQVKDFPKLLNLMKPYLSTVNINGMKTDGPMILTIGLGDSELGMLQQLKDSGYKGTIGVLSHVDDEDAKVVLARNIEGLKKLLKEMGDGGALKTY
ncbi:MAG: xylose isomerase [Cyclobacteriaceae bacterium]